MSRPRPRPNRLTPELLIRVYSAGFFPMSEDRQDPTITWWNPPYRSIFPLDRFHVPRSVQKILRRKRFEVRCDAAFGPVIRACAETGPQRAGTWINDEIIEAYTALHRLGFAHSVEAWQGGTLVGGLYGVSIGGAFFGESMFSWVSDASKVALVHLVARLRLGRYRLLDTQFITAHLKRFGAIEIAAETYLARLDAALGVEARFYSDPPPDVLESELSQLFRQSRTQTS